MNDMTDAERCKASDSPATVIGIVLPSSFIASFNSAILLIGISKPLTADIMAFEASSTPISPTLESNNASFAISVASLRLYPILANVVVALATSIPVLAKALPIPDTAFSYSAYVCLLSLVTLLRSTIAELKSFITTNPFLKP